MSALVCRVLALLPSSPLHFSPPFHAPLLKSAHARLCSALNPRRAYEQSVVSRHLRAGAETFKRKAPAHIRQVAGIKVQVLSSVKPSTVSASARDFLKQRLYGADIRRSEAMLHPVNAAMPRR